MAVKKPFPSMLIRLARRYVVKHSWQTFLMVLGIALGVAVMVSIDLANASASQAFSLSAEAVTGKATHQIQSASGPMDEDVYIDLKTSGVVSDAAPVIASFVSSTALGSQPYQLLGVDPFADTPFRSYLGSDSEIPLDSLGEFLTKPGAVFISRTVAERYSLESGDRFSIDIDGRLTDVYLAGTISSEDSLTRRTLDGLILADIATAQELTGKKRLIDRIDLILPENDAEKLEQMRSLMPSGILVEEVEARKGSIEEMTSAFQLNLSALSMLALIVGLFLIYNTMTFSVIRRRELFGTLRSLGVTRQEIFTLVMSEALIVGVVGSLIGVGLGILMGRNTVAMVTQTVNDLYFTTTVRDTGPLVSSLIKGGVIGVFATLVTAIPPALEAAAVEPRSALLRSGLERKTRLVIWLLSLGGLLLIGLGVLLFNLPANNIVFGFGGTMLVVVGFAMISAIVMRGFLTLITPVTGRLFGSIGRMAPRNLVNTLSRTAVAVSALMVAVAVTIGVTLMIDSFRYTVNVWMEQTLQGDIYISAPSFKANTPTIAIDQEVVSQVREWNDLERVDLLRSTTIESPQGPIQISATSNGNVAGERLLKSSSGDVEQISQAFQSGAVLVSEPLANRLDLTSRDSMILYTPQGEKSFPVAGVFHDYSSSEGSLLMWRDLYQQIWDDYEVTSIGLRLPPGSDPDQVVRDLQTGLDSDQRLVIRSNLGLRTDVLEVFDRTFAITAALQLLATIVAFIGILSTLLLLQLERKREIGILKALGLTGRELWKLVMLETGLMGLTAGLLAIPTGIVLSIILIYVINLRSFGWTLQLMMQPQAFALGLIVAITAALLAGIIPAVRLSRMQAADAIRYE